MCLYWIPHVVTLTVLPANITYCWSIYFIGSNTCDTVSYTHLLTVIEHIIWKFWFWFDLMFNKVIFWSDLWMIRLLRFFGAVWFNFSLDQHSLWTVIASKFFYIPHIICTGECCRCCNQIFFMQRKNSRSWISMAFYIYIIL